MLALSAPVFAVAAWLAGHLLSRCPAKPPARRTALALTGYALALACSSVADAAGADGRWWSAPFAVSLLLWPYVLFALAERPASRRWHALVAAFAAGTAVTAVLTGPATAFAIGALLPLAAMAAAARSIAHATVRALAVAATVACALGLWLPAVAPGHPLAGLALPLLGADLVVLATAVAVADAREDGQALRADLARSALSAGIAGVVFGGQVALVMAVVGTGPAMTALLYGTVGAAVIAQSLHAAFHKGVDRLAFAGRPDLRSQREELRSAAEALPRRAASGSGDADNAAAALAGLDDTAFTKLVRRALSDYPHPGRLLASPLTGLPAVAERLGGGEALPLDRAAALKAVLREGIERLRPEPGGFAVTDEWRFFNALYYPYVVGLRPYSTRARHEGLDEDAAAALRWFRAGVPERTLHNWQNTAAGLIAADLRRSAGGEGCGRRAGGEGPTERRRPADGDAAMEREIGPEAASATGSRADSAVAGSARAVRGSGF